MAQKSDPILEPAILNHSTKLLLVILAETNVSADHGEARRRILFKNPRHSLEKSMETLTLVEPPDKQNHIWVRYPVVGRSAPVFER